MGLFGDILVGTVKLIGKAGGALLDAAADKAETAARTGSYNGHRLSNAQRAEMQAKVDRYREGQARREAIRQVKDMGLDDNEIEDRLREMGLKKDY